MFTPKGVAVPELGPGEIGFITAGIKTVADCRVGDTITEDRRPAAEPLPGFKPVQPVVFCGLFPTDAADYEQLRDSLAKLRLNDASFEYEPETSAALGFGFRCGFLGPAASRDHPGAARARVRSRPDHDRAVGRLPGPSDQRRGAARCTTRPTCPIRCGSTISRSRGSRRRSWCPTTISAPILALCEERRGVQQDLTYAGNRAMLVYRLPLNEVVFDFYDRLKSVSRGYASFDYQIDGYDEGDLVLMNILVNGEPVDALVDHRPPQPGRAPRPRAVRAAEGPDPAPALPDRDPGGDRRPHHRPRDGQGAAQGRARQMLWRRHHAASASCSKSRRKAKSGCASSARSRSRNPPSSPPSRWATAEPARRLVEPRLGAPPAACLPQQDESGQS